MPEAIARLVRLVAAAGSKYAAVVSAFDPAGPVEQQVALSPCARRTVEITRLQEMLGERDIRDKPADLRRALPRPSRRERAVLDFSGTAGSDR